MKRLWILASLVAAFSATAATTLNKTYTAVSAYPAGACTIAAQQAERDSRVWLQQGWSQASQSQCSCQNAGLEYRCGIEVTYWRP